MKRGHEEGGMCKAWWPCLAVFLSTTHRRHRIATNIQPEETKVHALLLLGIRVLDA